jgi:hypothetical protein
MSTVEKPQVTDPQADADAAEVLRLVAAGQRVTDPDLRRRVHERAARIRQEILEKDGLVNIAVPSIRELRDS